MHTCQARSSVEMRYNTTLLVLKLAFCQALGETAAWFKQALSVERVKGALRLSGYSACGQDGGVQLPRQYIDGGYYISTLEVCMPLGLLYEEKHIILV